MVANSLRTLLSELVDYAGLFPPAKLGMDAAAEAYNRARMGEHEWMLGRFVCPAARLGELSKAAGPMMPGTLGTSGYREMDGAGEPWRVSALIEPDSAGNIEAGLDAIDAFNERHAGDAGGMAEVDMVEIRVGDATQIDVILDQMPEGLFPFLEFPITTDCRGVIAALSGSMCGAKIRTGGVVGNAFPTPAEVSAFLRACHQADVPFKATAGLHHPLRGSHRLTYEKDSASCVMHGFLNVFVAAALVRTHNVGDDVVQQILTESHPEAFKASEQVLGWKNHLCEVGALANVRERFAMSFGSCSFDEPVEDLAKLRWLRG
jgi:hypothetical protein